MENQVYEVLTGIARSFLHLWPWFLVTIPLSVITEVTGVSRLVSKALNGRQHVAILLAVAVGAFSPLCSCGVIPVIYSLLKGGVPLAPVMAFWIASPSMDPEMFFLSVATLGWNLAVWRLAATFLLSLSAGYLTLLATRRGWLGDTFLREKQTPECACKGDGGPADETSLGRRILGQTLSSTLMVMKFMLLAIALTAAINLVVPSDAFSRIPAGDGFISVALAGIIGVPLYTSNLTALPLVGGLLGHGLEPAAALAFLISGPVTTLPAMSAVWGLTTRKVFFLYLSFSLVGSVFFGYVMWIVTRL